MLSRVLRDYHDREPPQLVRRDLEAEFPATGKCVTVIGPRRAGKTCFLLQRVGELRRSAPGEEVLFIDMDDERLLGLRLEDMDAVLMTFREMYPDSLGRTTHVFLDEVQEVVGWERFVRRLIELEDVRVHITGSSSRLLSTEVATSMRGRSLTYTILPFSLGELLRARGIDHGERMSSEGQARVLGALREYMLYGGFPQVVMEPRGEAKVALLRQLVEIMLVRDIIERHSVRNIAAIRLLLNNLLLAMGREFSVNRFHALARSRGMKVGKNALYEYMRHMEDAFMIVALRRYDPKPREIQWSIPKVYPIDPGLVAQVQGRSSEDLGRTMECLVALELIRRRTKRPWLEAYYWKDPHGKEVDFVLREGPRTAGLIQVCYDLEGMGTRERELKPLAKAADELGCEDLTILTWDRTEELSADGHRVKVVPLWRRLLGLEPQG